MNVVLIKITVPHLVTLIMLPNCTFIKLQSIPFTTPYCHFQLLGLQKLYRNYKYSTRGLFICSPLYIWKTWTIQTEEYVTPTIIYNHRAIQHAQAEKPAIDPFYPNILASGGLKKCWLFSQHNTVCLESRCALRIWYVDLVDSIDVDEVCCCFTVFSC
jgi:hypothetical protein